MSSKSDFNSVAELQWAHATLIRLISVVQLNGFVGTPLSECLIHMTKSVELLEGLIQEHLAKARLRRDELR